MPMHVEYCEGLFTYVTYKGVAVCNPWLRQIRWISTYDHCYDFNGMGYDNSRPDKHYKIFRSNRNTNTMSVVCTDFGSDEWKLYEYASDKWQLESFYSVSLNGTLYWVAFNYESREHFIQSFDFSTERFEPYCILPTKNARGPCNAISSLAVYREDRFSYLEQVFYNPRAVEIWVTKEKIKNGDGEGVEWVNLMSVLLPEWSSLKVNYYPPSYFIVEDKSLMTLVMCCYNKEGKAYIYIAKGDKFHQIEIKDLVEYYHPRHRTYFPSLVQVPTFTMTGRGITQQNEVESRFAHPRGVQVSGGVGGDEWDDGVFDNVKHVTVGFNYHGITFVKFNYCNGIVVVTGATHGDSTTATCQVAIDDYIEAVEGTGATHGDSTKTREIIQYQVAVDDYIEAVEGTYTESHITSIAFRLHKDNESLLLGSFEGKSFALGGGRGSKILGFYGRSSDDHLTALGVHLSPFP
ncbi:PREDICTED: jacalin-related lectin 38-like [Camelina sativa]|uniref:Jacalin-related lectin 38-like n=1 Tax=Camelina sativa TaxID=90675 RepID=A0ABM0Z983_CAMSA|nr:PREDICTED: jacalin-related lectin 38-like [Camelina sativa]